MKFLLSLIFWALGIVITAASFITSVIVKYWPFPVKNRAQLVHSQSFWWSDALIALNPYWKVKVSGLENIDHTKTYVVVANHQSLADIILIYQTHMYFKWVAKEELLKVPFIGGLLWVNDHVLVAREDLGSVKEVYRKAAAYLKSGITMLFFPEGTRSRTDEMGEFKNGAFKLAIKEGKPVLPVYIGGTREAIPRGGFVFKAKVSAKVVVFPPIDTSQMTIADYGALRDRVRDQLKAESLKA